MKLKKAKKLLKELGVSTIYITEGDTDEEASEKDWVKEGIEIDCDKPHECDDDKVIFNSVNMEAIYLDCVKPSKKDKKKKKKKSKKDKYTEELNRIKRNIQHIKTGEGAFEESAEELEKRENARQAQAEKQRNYPPNTNRSKSSDNHQENSVDNTHHQNTDANRNNTKRRYNNRNRNSSSTETSTNYVSENPVNENKKEE